MSGNLSTYSFCSVHNSITTLRPLWGSHLRRYSCMWYRYGYIHTRIRGKLKCLTWCEINSAAVRCKHLPHFFFLTLLFHDLGILNRYILNRTGGKRFSVYVAGRLHSVALRGRGQLFSIIIWNPIVLTWYHIMLLFYKIVSLKYIFQANCV